MPITEVKPGLHQWSTHNPQIDADVSSHLIGAALVDPREPQEGWDALPTRPEVVVLSSGNHLREAGAAARHFGGLPIRGVRAAQERLASEGKDVTLEVVESEEEAAPGLQAIVVGVLSDDETALLVTDVTGGALLIADGLLPMHDGTLGFVPDALLGEEPEQVKAGLKERLATLLDRDFDTLLFAHGLPITDRAKEKLRAAVS